MVGEKLSELLEIKKIKPGTLAAKTGISKYTIYSIIKRNNKNVNYSTMEKIAEFLEVPVEYFYGKEPENEKKAQPVPDEAELDEFVRLLSEMDDSQRAFILSAMRGILKGQE